MDERDRGKGEVAAVVGDTRSRRKFGDSHSATLSRRLRALGLLPLFVVLFSSVGAAAAQAPGGGRAWELVSPSEPVGAVVRQVLAIAPDGDGIVYAAISSMPGAPSGDLISRNRAVREAGGWRTEPLGAPYEDHLLSINTLFSPFFKAVSEDLASSVWISSTPLVKGGPEEPRAGLYRLGGSGDVTLLADLGKQGQFLGGSADLSHVVFGTVEHLLPSDVGRSEGQSIYEATGSGLSQVDLDTDDSLLSACGSSIPSPSGVSRSGSRIFFMNPSSSGQCGAHLRVYLREAGVGTVEISASQCNRSDCNEPQDVRFVDATPDGSVAFLVTSQQLTDEDEDSTPDLYRYEAEGGDLDLISAGSPGTEATVQEGNVQVSADGSRVYFYASGSLVAGQSTETGTNLYLADAAGVHLVGPFEDGPDPLQVSLDGGIAAISTATPLVPADEDERQDVYLFEAESRKFTLVSRGSAGGNGAFDATISSSLPVLLDEPLRRSLSDDGSRVFFSTEEELLPEDHNEALDVYEWAGGELTLISSGEGEDDAELASSSPDGGTIVFRTAASLLPSDRDGGNYDFYVARVGGGFSESEPVSPCDECEPPPVDSPVRLRAATMGLPAPRKRARIELHRPGADAGSQLAESGYTVLSAFVPAPGRVYAEARGLLNGKARIVGRGVTGALRSGRVHLRLVATDEAQRALGQGGVLRVRLTVRQGSVSATRRLTLRTEE